MSKWRQKCSPLQIIEQLTEKTWEQGCVIFGEQKNKERNGKTHLRKGEYFEWMNTAIIEFGFLRMWRILQITEGVIHLGLRPLWITPSLICRILHILLSLIHILWWLSQWRLLTYSCKLILKNPLGRVNKHYIVLYISINLLAFYHECRSLIGYATHVLFNN